MINPYEAPQTTKPALPPQAPTLEPQLALQQGARRCALGGKLLMAAAIGEALGIGDLIWIQQAKQHGTTNLLNFCGWILLYGSWLLLLAGAILNLLGYARFIHYLDHEALVKIFRDCRRVVWFKFVLLITLVVCTAIQIVAIMLFVALIGMMIHSCIVHARAMQIWNEHFPDSAARTARGVFFASGIAATLFGGGIIAIAIQHREEPSNILLFGLMLVFALSFAAFADFYGRLRKALAVIEAGEASKT